jgi:hypothetical protein
MKYCCELENFTLLLYGDISTVACDITLDEGGKSGDYLSYDVRDI